MTTTNPDEVVRRLRSLADEFERGTKISLHIGHRETIMFDEAADIIESLTAKPVDEAELREVLAQEVEAAAMRLYKTNVYAPECAIIRHGSNPSIITEAAVSAMRRVSAPIPAPDRDAVTDDMVKAAQVAFNTDINNPVMEKCARCAGSGYHHGFGEDGQFPDWCLECGGAQFTVRPGEEYRAMRAALEAALKTKPTPPADRE